MAPSVQVDASGKVHIAYLRTQTGAGVYYATNASGTWVTQLAWAGAARWGPALALDVNGSAHIAITADPSTTPNGTYYVTNRTGTWSVTRVVPRETQDRPAIAVTSGGKVHIVAGAFQAGGAGNELVHATNASGSWVVSQLTDSPDFSPSAAVDGSGKSPRRLLPLRRHRVLVRRLLRHQPERQLGRRAHDDRRPDHRLDLEPVAGARRRWQGARRVLPLDDRGTVA